MIGVYSAPLSGACETHSIFEVLNGYKKDAGRSQCRASSKRPLNVLSSKGSIVNIILKS